MIVLWICVAVLICERYTRKLNKELEDSLVNWDWDRRLNELLEDEHSLVFSLMVPLSDPWAERHVDILFYNKVDLETTSVHHIYTVDIIGGNPTSERNTMPSSETRIKLYKKVRSLKQDLITIQDLFQHYNNERTTNYTSDE